MYRAQGDKVYVVQAHLDTEELFLTVHPTDTGGTKTVEEQAQAIADILNDL